MVTEFWVVTFPSLAVKRMVWLPSDKAAMFNGLKDTFWVVAVLVIVLLSLQLPLNLYNISAPAHHRSNLIPLLQE